MLLHWNTSACGKMRHLQQQLVCCCQFFVALHCLADVLSLTLTISQFLQKESANLSQVAIAIDNVLEVFRSRRLQAGLTNVQSTQHWDTIIPQPSHQTKDTCTSPSLFIAPATTENHHYDHFADRAFRCTASTVWRSLNSYTVDSGSLAVFKSRLKTFLFRRTFHPV